MKIQIHRKSLRDLNTHEIRRFTQLSFRDGLLRPEFQNALFDNPDQYSAFQAKMGRKIAGWALVGYNSKYANRKYPCIMMYVDPDYRRMGIGTGLLEAVKEEARGRGCERLVVLPWDDKSRAFYKAQGEHPVNQYRHWIELNHAVQRWPRPQQTPAILVSAVA